MPTKLNKICFLSLKQLQVYNTVFLGQNEIFLGKKNFIGKKIHAKIS
jgi:hypothetical protein